MKPATLKLIGYLISTVSVGALGAAAWPGAAEAGCLPLLILGMATSVIGMGCRWLSYEAEERRKKNPGDARPALGVSQMPTPIAPDAPARARPPGPPSLHRSGQG